MIYDQYGNELSAPPDFGMQGEPWTPPTRRENIKVAVIIIAVEVFAVGTLLLAWTTR